MIYSHYEYDIYGPSASGKLTIANGLTKLIVYKVFRNHISRDMVQDIYQDKLTENYELINELRSTIIRYCAKNGTNLIFTYVYDGPQDNEPVERYIKDVTDNNKNVLFVELTATHNDLIKRIDNESRQNFKKLISKDVLKELLQTLPYTSIPSQSIFKVNTSEITPRESAIAISEHFEVTRD